MPKWFGDTIKWNQYAQNEVKEKITETLINCRSVGKSKESNWNSVTGVEQWN